MWLQLGLGSGKGRAGQTHLLQDLVNVVCLGCGLVIARTYTSCLVVMGTGGKRVVIKGSRKVRCMVWI